MNYKIINWEHILGISLIGIGGIVLMLKGETTAGATLFGAIGGYVFKNGKNSFKTTK